MDLKLMQGKPKRRWWIIGFMGLLFALLLSISCVDKLGPSDSTDTATLFVNDTMMAALFRFRIDNGRYPTTEEGLAVMVTRPENSSANWKGPYIEKMPLDPWGHEYQYRYPGIRNSKRFDLWSMGPDGVNSEDDIGNW